jgi:hypothetical protein
MSDMSDTTSIKYDVSIKHLSERPMATADGHFTKAVEFHVEPLAPSDEAGSPFDFDCGAVGGETLYRTSLIEEKGHLIVELPTSWLHSRSTSWQQEVVNFALQQAASECA